MVKYHSPVPPALLIFLILFCRAASPGRCTETASIPSDEAAPGELLDAFQSRLKTWKDYSLTLESKVSRGDKSSHDILEYAFRQPNYFRSRVIRGNDEGSTVARGASGKIRAKSGGRLLGRITITMEETDPRLADVRGARIQDADWGAILALFLQCRDKGWQLRRLPDEVVGGEPCFVIEVSGAGDPTGETRRVLCLARRDLTMRASRIWEGALQVDDTLYYDIKLNPATPDEFFKL